MKIEIKKKLKKVKCRNRKAEIVGVHNSEILLVRFIDENFGWRSAKRYWNVFVKDKLLVMHITEEEFFRQDRSYSFVDKSEILNNIISIRIN